MKNLSADMLEKGQENKNTVHNNQQCFLQKKTRIPAFVEKRLPLHRKDIQEKEEQERRRPYNFQQYFSATNQLFLFFLGKRQENKNTFLVKLVCKNIFTYLSQMSKLDIKNLRFLFLLILYFNMCEGSLFVRLCQYGQLPYFLYAVAYL